LRKTPLAILLLLILITAGIYAHSTIHSQKERERQHQLLEQRIVPLVDTFIEEGYSNQTARERALAFDSLHVGWAIDNRYNQSVIRYAVGLNLYPLTTSVLFDKTRSVDKTATALNMLWLYLGSSFLPDEKGAELVNKWYPELFDKSKETGKSLLFGDFDEDQLVNLLEIELGHNPLVFDRGNSTVLSVYSQNLKNAEVVYLDIKDLVPSGYPSGVSSELQKIVESRVLADGNFSLGEETALSYLSKFDGLTQRMIIEGLNNDTIKWLSLLSYLNNQTFAEYAVKNRLGIGCGEFTELKGCFLLDPQRYGPKLLQKMLSEIRSRGYDQLVDEWVKLPEFNSTSIIANVEATEDLLHLISVNDTEVYEMIGDNGLMIRGGTPDQRDFSYPVPKYNTEIHLLRWLAEDEEFKPFFLKKENSKVPEMLKHDAVSDTLALSIAATSGIFDTMGTEEVRQALRMDNREFLEFGRSTSELQKALGLPYNLENYPLEAKVCWAWRGNEIMKWNPLKWQPKMPTSLVYYSNKPLPLVIYEKDTVSIAALRKMRELVKARFLSKNVNTMITKVEEYFWIGTNGLWEFTTLPKLVTDENGLDAYRDVDWQFNRYLQGIKMKGDCSTEMGIVDAFSKSIGISTIPHWALKKQLPIHSHAFNWYYDPISGKWKVAQIHFTIPQFENEAIYDWHIYLPPINQKGYLYNRLEENNGIETYYGNYLYAFRNIKVRTMKEKLVIGIPQNEMKTYILYSR